ncbi:helix-turn-helix domain-containing protein [Actinomadura kijaniata]|uniref:helix-turn-helix domain-containing protein n=1 Tax=Actinomadura kijaniata TaxID=46161 RepID=UPI003F1DE9FF
MARTPSVRRRRLGIELRRLRELRGQTVEEVAIRLHWSPSKLSRIETARISVRISDVCSLLDHYGVDDPRRSEMLALAHSATRQGWWNAYEKDLHPVFAAFIALEDEASSMFQHSTYTVPGLLQSNAYARSVLASARSVEGTLSPQTLETRVTVRMHRQSVLHRDNPPRLSGVIDESVLLRVMGSQKIMREQLFRLVELAESPDIELRVLPLAVPHAPILGTTFNLLRFSPAYDVTFPDVVHLEGIEPIEITNDAATYLYLVSWHTLRSCALSRERSAERLVRAAKEI